MTASLADRLPPEILARGKKGFGVPLAAWFRGPLAPLLKETLAPARIEAAGVFDPVAVRRLVDAHLAGRDHARALWALFVFERWRAHHMGAGPLV